MSYHLELLPPEQDERLIEFLDRLGAQSPSILGYHYPFYRDMLQSLGVGTPTYWGAFQRDALVGVLPVFCRSGAFGPVYSSLPFFGPNGGVLCDPAADAEQVHALLLNALIDKARAANALTISVYTPFLGTSFASYDKALAGGVTVQKFTQYVSPATAKRKSSLGNDLRKAIAAGITVTTEVTPERVTQFYEFYRSGCEQVGIPLKPRACIDTLTSPQLVGRHTRIYFGYHEKRLIAGLLVILSPSTVSYFVPAFDRDFGHFQPNALLIDHAMRELCGTSTRLWNWESSPNRESGVYSFKKKWGSVESDYRVYLRAFRPESELRDIGRAVLEREYPHFFVWPYNRFLSG